MAPVWHRPLTTATERPFKKGWGISAGFTSAEGPALCWLWQRFERDVPVEAPIVSEDKLIEIRVNVLAAQPMIGPEPPTFHQREDSMDPGQHDMAGHLADRPRARGEGGCRRKLEDQPHAPASRP